MKTPAFWYRTSHKSTLVEQFLMPLSWVYNIGHRFNQSLSTPTKINIPVICIGNLVAGGSGKTPIALAMLKLIKQHKTLTESPCFLTRGYGNDEDKILAQHAPTIVNPDRAQGARDILLQSADFIIMDDGLQNNSLYKDISFIVIDGSMGLGNLKTLPAGPLREPLEDGCRRADAIIMIGEDTRNISALLPKNLPIFNADINVEKTPAKDKKYIAFAGLGYPQKFFNTLDSLKLNVIEHISYPDHYAYKTRDIENLLNKALEQNASLITTEKDYIRIPKHQKQAITTLPITVQFRNENSLVAFIKDNISP